MSQIQIDYSRADRDRRMELLRLYAGDLARAKEVERWIVCGETAETGRGNLDAGDVALRAPDEPRETATQFATGNEAHEGEDDGSDGNSEGRGSEGLQPERQSGRGGDQGGDGSPRDEDGGHPRPEQRAGGPRGGGGDHQPPDGQHVVRAGGDQGPVGVGRGVDAPSTPPLGAVAEGDSPQRVADPEDIWDYGVGRGSVPMPTAPVVKESLTADDGLEIPAFLRRSPVTA